MAEGYDLHRADEDYLALRDEMALVSAQIEEAANELSGLRPLDPAQFDKEDRQSRIKDMLKAQTRVLELIEHRRVLARTETQRIQAAQDSLRGEAVRAFGSAVLQAVREEADGDWQLVQRVQQRVINILRSYGVVADAPPEGG